MVSVQEEHPPYLTTTEYDDNGGGTTVDQFLRKLVFQIAPFFVVPRLQIALRE